MAGETPQIEHNYLSKNCGLKVSKLGLGTMTFGGTHGLMLPGNSDEAMSHKIMDRFVECGGNMIDTANNYNWGESEQIIGTWLKKQTRDDIVIATKCRFWEKFPLPVPKNKINSEGLSRKNIIRCVEQSLENLQTSYIDLYQIHGWDPNTPLKETLSTMNDLVRCGKVRYCGASNMAGFQMQQIVDYNKFMGFTEWVTLQQGYNLIDRGSDAEAFRVCRNEGLGVLTWSPLKGGLLTGKYTRGSPIPKDTRLHWSAQDKRRQIEAAPDVQKYLKDEKFLNLIDIMQKAAKAHGKTVAQVALRWLMQKPPVSCVLAGSRTLSQLESNIGAATGWKLTYDEMVALEKASRWETFYPYNFLEQLEEARDVMNVEADFDAKM